MALASVALNTARTFLNDDTATIWSDALLLPKLQHAHRELQVELDLAGIPVIKNATAVIAVAAGVTDFSTISGYPTNLVDPQWMKERSPGQQERDFIDMQEVEFIPELNQTTELVYWCWIDEKIKFLGSTQNREVKLRYVGGIPVPASGGDNIGFIYGEIYLSHRTAALAADSVGNKLAHDEWTAEARANIEKILGMNIKGLQNLPARRRPYHRGRGRSRVLRDF